MRCAECGLYECVLRSPMGGCPNGEKAQTEETITLGDGPASIYDFGIAGIGITQDAYSVLVDAAKSLVDAVEKYVNPKKGEYLHRSELLIKIKELKEILK